MCMKLRNLSGGGDAEITSGGGDAEITSGGGDAEITGVKIAVEGKVWNWKVKVLL